MSLERTMNQLQQLLTALSKDMGKVTRGNRTAAQRVRTGTVRLEKLGKLFRKESIRAEKTGKFRKKVKARLAR
jgi:hypothetical protein